MIAAVALLLAWQATPELQHHVEAGLNAKRAGDLDTAIREFKRVAELAPGLAAASDLRLSASCSVAKTAVRHGRLVPNRRTTKSMKVRSRGVGCLSGR